MPYDITALNADVRSVTLVGRARLEPPQEFPTFFAMAYTKRVEIGRLIIENETAAIVGIFSRILVLRMRIWLHLFCFCWRGVVNREGMIEEVEIISD